jgi:hypothetical protein
VKRLLPWTSSPCRRSHCNGTKHPSSAWVIQQLSNSAPGYLIFDRGANFNEEVIDTVKSFGI